MQTYVHTYIYTYIRRARVTPIHSKYIYACVTTLHSKRAGDGRRRTESCVNLGGVSAFPFAHPPPGGHAGHAAQRPSRRDCQIDGYGRKGPSL
eukprot:703226-Amorphochlora_amoeboformis.AAC.2